jgi:two-component system cell cycle sensor histidine kinase/response regulator CckA
VRVRTFVAEVDKAMRLEGGLADSDYLCLEISDTGSGIEPDLRGKIFDPFFTTKRDGRGLGLSIVHGIVRAHRGAVDLISTPGQGTTFQILLPAESMGRRRRSNRSGPIAINSATQPANVLVIEDEELLRSAIGKALRRKNFSVVEAASGSEAIKLLRASASGVDVVLLDVTLPGMPSRETYENILRIQPGTRVIFTSAYGREVVDASLGGFSPKRFIRKPFQLGELVDAIKAAISE